jgi:hypothetical protein
MFMPLVVDTPVAFAQPCYRGQPLHHGEQLLESKMKMLIMILFFVGAASANVAVTDSGDLVHQQISFIASDAKVLVCTYQSSTGSWQQTYKNRGSCPASSNR